MRKQRSQPPSGNLLHNATRARAGAGNNTGKQGLLPEPSWELPEFDWSTPELDWELPELDWGPPEFDWNLEFIPFQEEPINFDL